MRYPLVLIPWLICSHTPAEAQPSPADAIRALQALGATLKVDTADPARPIIGVALTSNRNVRDSDLKYLAAFPKLQELDLWNTPLTNKGMVHLENLMQLRLLRLDS